MATIDMERVSHLEGAYEHMATKAELSTLNGDYRVEFAGIRHQFELIERRFQSIEDTMRSMQILLQQFMERMEERMDRIEARLDSVEERLDRIESSNARLIGFQTSGRTLRDDGDDY